MVLTRSFSDWVNGEKLREFEEAKPKPKNAYVQMVMH